MKIKDFGDPVRDLVARTLGKWLADWGYIYIQASPVGCMCVAAFVHRMWAVELNLSLTVCVGRSAERLGHNRTRLMYIVSVARASLGFRV